MKLQKLIDDYMNYLEYEKNSSENTIKNYKLWLDRFLEYAGNIDIKEIDKFLVLDFRKQLSEKDLSVKTINYHITALRAFIKFLQKNDIEVLAPDKLELANTPDRTIDFLDEKEVEKLMSMPDQHTEDKLQKLRDKGILYTLYGSGLRVSELIELKKEDIKLESNQITIVGK